MNIRNVNQVQSEFQKFFQKKNRNFFGSVNFVSYVCNVDLKIIKICKLMNKSYAVFCLLLGVFFFGIFAYDIEYDRDLTTWVWLLSSILWFLNSLVHTIKFLLKENK